MPFTSPSALITWECSIVRNFVESDGENSVIVIPPGDKDEEILYDAAATNGKSKRIKSVDAKQNKGNSVDQVQVRKFVNERKDNVFLCLIRLVLNMTRLTFIYSNIYAGIRRR